MKLKLILISSLCAAALSACSILPSSAGKTSSSAAARPAAESSAPQTEAEGSSSQDSETAENLPASSAEEAGLQTLLDLMGEHDSQVVSVLGEGSAVENEGVILNRDYALNVLGEDASVTLFFNLYQSDADLLEQCTVRLEKQSLEEYEALLEKELGQPSETYENSYFFNAEGSTVVLADPHDDGPYLEISLNSAGE